MLVEQYPTKRTLILTPTNLAARGIGTEVVKARHRYGRAPKNYDNLDVLLLESRHAALSIEEKETAVIKQRQETTEILENMRLKSHLIRILEQADAIPNPQDISKVFKGWHEDSRQKIENYLATKEADIKRENKKRY